MSYSLPLTLRRRIHLLNARYNRWLGWGVAAALLLPLILLLALLLVGAQALPEGAMGKLLESLREELAGDPIVVLALAALPAAALFLWLQWRHEKLTVTSWGIEYRSPLRGPLGFLHGVRPDWRLPWSDISAAGLKQGGTGLQQLPSWRIVLREHNGKVRRLGVYAWYAQPDEAGLGIGELTRFDAALCRRAVERSPLYRVLAERGLPDADADTLEEAAPDYDLRTHKGLWALVVAFFALAGYAVADAFFLTPWRAVEPPPAGPFVLAAVVAAAAAALAGRGAPALERWAVTGLVAAATAAALYPALLRFNAVTDPDGVSGYRYRQVAVARFESVDRPAMPELVFDRGMEFWESLPADGEREFRLARGTPGFWQLDLAEVREAQRAFYREYLAED